MTYDDPMRALASFLSLLALTSMSGCSCDAPASPDAARLDGGPDAGATLDAPTLDGSTLDALAIDAENDDAPVVELDAALDPDASDRDAASDPDAAVDPDAGCAGCRGLYATGSAITVCEGLSTDPNVSPTAPELAAGDGTFAITCVPVTTASAADDTVWRVDLVDATSFARTSLPLSRLVIARPFVSDVRVIFEGGRFVTAAEMDCESSAHLYRGCTAVHSFLPDGSDLRGWPFFEESAGANFARALAPLGDVLVLARRNASASDRAWALADDSTATAIAFLTGDTGTAEPITIDLVTSTDGFVRIASSNTGLAFTRFSAAGALLAPPVSIATSLRVSRPTVRPRIVRDGETLLVSFSDGGEGVLLRLDAEGTELARASFTLPSAWAHAHSLHVAEGLIYVVHPGASGPALEVSVFDRDLTLLPERSAPFFTSGTLMYPAVAHDPATDTFAIAYRTSTGTIALQRFVHRP
ncbi:MAG: hypothetical protein J0L92_29645 [Deltaproteobacteria bacterium]|nr:hypothetical protein [Deltaproteobacteria bacterium]